MIGGADEAARDEDIGFLRATRKEYRVFSKHLGPLRRLYVRQLPEPSATGTGWYLDRIEVGCTCLPAGPIASVVVGWGTGPRPMQF
jgi:hypothetical protein